MRLDAVLLLAVLAAPVPAAAAPASPPTAPGVERTDRGVRFELPSGFKVGETLEKEPGEEKDVVYVATQGAVEVRAEVEKGEFKCTATALAGTPHGSSTAGRATCEVELAAPPSLDPKVGPRRATSVLVQFPGRYLSVVVFAPDQATATRLARQVAASAAEEKK
jgi:hypothetical protein